MLENLHTVLQVSAGEFGLDFKADSSLASLDHSEVDGIVLVPIDESKITDNFFVFSRGAVPNLEVGNFPIGDGDRVSLNDVLPERNEKVDFVANSPIAPPAPILAHSFVNPDNVLKMTDAIDVVFYRGGTAEISDFELGRDILWFSIEKKELAKSNNTVNQNGDLILDFGDSGM